MIVIGFDTEYVHGDLAEDATPGKRNRVLCYTVAIFDTETGKAGTGIIHLAKGDSVRHRLTLNGLLSRVIQAAPIRHRLHRFQFF